MAEEITVHVDDIYLDKKNPRFEKEQKSQRAALEKIVDGETLALARHIAKHGLNPLDRMAIFYDEEVKKYVTAEGNRRLAALKLLTNFALIDSLDVPKGTKAELKKTPKGSLSKLTSIPCVLFESKRQASLWVKLKHTGKNGGVGTVQWDREQQQRFDSSYSEQKPPQLQVLDFLRREFAADKVVSERLNDSFPLTTLERLLGDPQVREFLGVELKDKTIYAALEKGEVLKGFKKVIFDLTDPDKDKRETTRTLGKKSDRTRYIETFKAKSVLPNHKLGVPPYPLDEEVTVDTRAAPASTAKKPSITISTEKRTKLFTPSCALTIKDNQRINDIYHNLKSGLDVEKFTNAVSVLARLFIEMSVNHYLRTKMGKKESEVASDARYSLQDRLRDVVEHLKENGKITAGVKQAIGKELGNSNSAFHPNSLNAFVHNPNFHPSALDLKQRWNNVEPLIIAIWS